MLGWLGCVEDTCDAQGVDYAVLGSDAWDPSADEVVTAFNGFGARDYEERYVSFY